MVLFALRTVFQLSPVYAVSALQRVTDPLCKTIWPLIGHSPESPTTLFAAFLFSNPHSISLAYKNIPRMEAGIVLAEARKEKAMVFSPPHKQTAQGEQETLAGMDLHQEVILLACVNSLVRLCIWDIALSLTLAILKGTHQPGQWRQQNNLKP